MLHDGRVSFNKIAITITSLCYLTLALGLLFPTTHRLVIVGLEGIVVLILTLHVYNCCHLLLRESTERGVDDGPGTAQTLSVSI